MGMTRQVLGTAFAAIVLIECKGLMPMFANRPVYATLPAADLNRAKRFYAEKLGLTPASEAPGGIFYQCGSQTRFFVYPSQGTASGTHTQMTWTVDNLETEVVGLKARGVVFEEYDQPNLRTVNSITTMGRIKTAWFKDSEGNLLGLVQYV
jgi:catechol 2,3-dioxygenase-like lactoylglutathione lyase family enzyme